MLRFLQTERGLPEVSYIGLKGEITPWPASLVVRVSQTFPALRSGCWIVEADIWFDLCSMIFLFLLL